MRKNIVKVMEAFRAGRAVSGDSKRTISTDGDTVFSYDMPIAQRLGDGKLEILGTKAAPTATTRGHISGVDWWMQCNGMDYAKEVACLTGRKAHVFRDRAGRDGYRDRGGLPPFSRRVGTY